MVLIVNHETSFDKFGIPYYFHVVITITYFTTCKYFSITSINSSTNSAYWNFSNNTKYKVVNKALPNTILSFS